MNLKIDEIDRQFVQRPKDVPRRACNQQTISFYEYNAKII
jgi:hypothetical protein